MSETSAKPKTKPAKKRGKPKVPKPTPNIVKLLDGLKDNYEDTVWSMRTELARRWCRIEKKLLDTLGAASKDLKGKPNDKALFNNLLRLIQRLKDIDERRSKLLGLDMPTRIAQTDPLGDRPLEYLSRDELLDVAANLRSKGKK